MKREVNRVFTIRMDDGESIFALYDDTTFIAPIRGSLVRAISASFLEQYGVVDIQEVFVHEKHSKFSSDPILQELVEETIAKSHREWRSIPETAVLVLRAIEDYGVRR